MDAIGKNLLLWTNIWIEIIITVVRGIPILIEELIYLVVPRKCKDIGGKTALVTGAAQGLGRELALELARNGCTVICVDILTEKNEITSEDVRKLGQKSSAFSCDISNREAVMELAKTTGPIDILVNNAGILYFDPILKTPPEVIQRIMDVNVISHFWMIQAFLPGMLERDQGHIVATASMVGMVEMADVVPYSCSKFAVVGIMKCLAEELRLQSRHNIKLSCVCPYIMNTIPEILNGRIESALPGIQPDEAAQMIVQGIQQERLMFMVPYYWNVLCWLLQMFPFKIQNKLRDIFYVRAHPRNSSGKYEKTA